MSEVPQEIQCYFDAEKPCPLRAAVYAVSQAGATPQEAAASLSRPDQTRLQAMTDESGPTQDIRPGTCRTGPTRWTPFVGRMACNAASVHYIYRNGRPEQGTAPAYEQG
ncbi:MAG TPA: hypothetical protein VFX84_00800 [Candidatus Saccharimonadales bacterium]|nr:hypothetical protein [Candidatus Saccharimonadales bacterium]